MNLFDELNRKDSYITLSFDFLKEVNIRKIIHFLQKIIIKLYN